MQRLSCGVAQEECRGPAVSTGPDRSFRLVGQRSLLGQVSLRSSSKGEVVFGTLGKSLVLLVGISMNEMSAADANLPPLTDDQVDDLKARIAKQKALNERLAAEDLAKLLDEAEVNPDSQDQT